MSTLFVTAGPIEWGSSRMRCYWPAQHMQAADVIQSSTLEIDASKYGAVVFQKVFNIETAEELRLNGVKVVWDVCDPAWWWEPGFCEKIIQNVDAVVASSTALADDFSKWSGMKAHVIKDRLDFEHFPVRHSPGRREQFRFIWYGVAVNRIALFSALANLERLAANGYAISLTVFDDRPETPVNFTKAFPVYHLRWDLSQENIVIASHDAALLPPYPGPWGAVKSDNKKRTAGACGLPVTDGQNYKALEDLVVNPERYAAYPAGDSVKKSADEWEALLCAL